MIVKIFGLAALSTLAVLLAGFAAISVNALSVHRHNDITRRLANAEAASQNGVQMKRKRDSGRCRQRPASASFIATSGSNYIPPSTSAEYPAVDPSSTYYASQSSLALDLTPESSSVASSSLYYPAPATTAYSSSAVPTSSSASGSSSSTGRTTKVGIAWPNGDDSSLSYYKTDKVSYLYSWSPYIPMLAESLGFVTIPQLWGYNQVSDFQRLVVPGYAQYVLGMNEPNEIGQSNMDATSGVQLWRTYIDPLKDQGYQLISPATSSAPSGKQWMEDFFAACTGCHFDGVALHWYDVKADDFIAYVTDFHDTFNLPVWVTEFACQNFNGGSQPTESEVFAFMNTVTAWMDSTDWVVAYFAFGVMHDMQGVNSASQLMSSSGLPTQLGYDYISS